MGKFLGTLVATLLILAATSLVGGLLKGPIDELASSDRLKASVELSPWYARPAGETKPKSVGAANDLEVAQKQLLASLQGVMANSSGSGDYQFARIIITNESSKVVTDVNLRLDEPYVPNTTVVVDSTGKESSFERQGRISLPDMKPGDRATIFVWGTTFSSLTFPTSLKTYSSAGKFRVSYNWPQSQSQDYESAIGQFLDNWAGWIGAISLVLVGLIAALYSAILNSYFKALLKNEKYYYAEQRRYDEKPESFTPSFDKMERAARGKI